MALVFQRSARNYVKHGYFPTDDETLRRLAQALNIDQPNQEQSAAGSLVRLFDPCCGEGAALSYLDDHLSARTQGGQLSQLTFGVELDTERAWAAKERLTTTIHSSIHDVVVKARSMSLLFLNPPYGFGLKDNVNATANVDEADKAERFERTFLKKTAPALMLGGVLVYIIPYRALDSEIRTYLARNFEDLRFYMAPVQTYKQCVILGRKVRAQHPRKAVLDMLTQAQAGAFMDQVLPQAWTDVPYVVPLTPDDRDFDFHAVRIDGPQLADELRRLQDDLLWTGFGQVFNQIRTEHRRPLREMSKWHLALALAAGQVTGLIKSRNGRCFLIKGDTYKQKVKTVETHVNENGDVSETITMLDRFVPAINAIEFTLGERLGNIVKIS